MRMKERVKNINIEREKQIRETIEEIESDGN